MSTSPNSRRRSSLGCVMRAPVADSRSARTARGRGSSLRRCRRSERSGQALQRTPRMRNGSKESNGRYFFVSWRHTRSKGSTCLGGRRGDIGPGHVRPSSSKQSGWRSDGAKRFVTTCKVRRLRYFCGLMATTSRNGRRFSPAWKSPVRAQPGRERPHPDSIRHNPRPEGVAHAPAARPMSRRMSGRSSAHAHGSFCRSSVTNRSTTRARTRRPVKIGARERDSAGGTHRRRVGNPALCRMSRHRRKAGSHGHGRSEEESGIRRKRRSVERGKPERVPWSDKSARATLVSKFLALGIGH
jgi:hypothetical protein